MDDIESLKGLKILNAITFLLMIAVNALANFLPLNGVTTGEVAKAYPNLFTPIEFTFLIWGLIYLFLALFILYQFGLFKDENSKREELIKEIGFTFAFSSIINAAWVVVWHYGLIPVSVLFMITLLISLISINSKLSAQEFSDKDKIFIKLPFSIYFAWITIAVIANIVILLASLGFNGFGISTQIWTVIVLALGLIICAAVTTKNRDAAYGLTAIWAYAGILYKHISADGFNGQYRAVVITAIVSLVLLLISVLFVLVVKRKHTIKL